MTDLRLNHLFSATIPTDALLQRLKSPLLLLVAMLVAILPSMTASSVIQTELPSPSDRGNYSYLSDSSHELGKRAVREATSRSGGYGGGGGLPIFGFLSFLLLLLNSVLLINENINNNNNNNNNNDNNDNNNNNNDNQRRRMISHFANDVYRTIRAAEIYS